ncbi:MAG: hypothetical protein MHM6MM_007446 [Cercozoa sp. M6MM]
MRQQHAQVVRGAVQALGYQHQNVTVQQVNYLLQNVQSLAPRRRAYTFPNGQVVHMLQVFGTVPITFQGNTYNIPVEIWFPPRFPYAPPMCYVVPTANMSIKARHRHVDTQGLIFLPYLSNWNARSSLIELVTMISSVFSADPPVYSKPPSGGGESRGQQRPQQQQQPQNERERLVQQVTQQLQQVLPGMLKEITTDMESLLKRQDDLRESSEKVGDGVQKMRQATENLRQKTAQLDAANQDLLAYVSQQEAMPEQSALDVVAPRDAWSQKMAELVAEDHALDDTVYALDKCLSDGRVSLDVYLRQVRKLSREQFFARALASKIFEAQQQLQNQQVQQQETAQVQPQYAQPQPVMRPREQPELNFPAVPSSHVTATATTTTASASADTRTTRTVMYG